MNPDFTKKYYKIGEVSEMLGLPESTLRYWEKYFTVLKPRRNDGGQRFYTPDDIDTLRLIHYLVKDKGLKLDAAREHLKANRRGLDRRSQALTTLQSLRDRVQALLDSL